MSCYFVVLQLLTMIELYFKCLHLQIKYSKSKHWSQEEEGCEVCTHIVCLRKHCCEIIELFFRIILAYFVRNESVSYYYLILEIPLERWFRIVFKMSPISRTRTSNMFGHSLIFIYLMILVVLCIGLCSSDELPGNNLNRKDEVRSVLCS